VPDHTSVLFICTGNICRSAFAEVAARSVFPDDRFSFTSAGTFTISRSAATLSMRHVAEEHGLDLSHHAATSLDRSEQPDVVLGMEQQHLVAARRQFPDLDLSRIRLLDHPAAIEDPYGHSMEQYRATAHRIVEVLSSYDLEAFR